MPSYYYSRNDITVDSVDSAKLAAQEAIIGQTPAAKHSEAHDTFTRNILLLLADTQNGDEGLIYDEIVSRGGYLYASVEYDYTNFFYIMTFESYWPTQEDLEDYVNWFLTKNMLPNFAIENDPDPRGNFLDPDNSPGRGFITNTRATVDFNKPYRT